MATHKQSSISKIRHPAQERLQGIGNVFTYDGIYEAVVVSAKDVQKNGRLKVRLANTNSNVNFIEENDPQSYLDITVQWSSPFAGATNLKDTIATGDPTAPGQEDPDKTFNGTQKSFGMLLKMPTYLLSPTKQVWRKSSMKPLSLRKLKGSLVYVKISKT